MSAKKATTTKTTKTAAKKTAKPAAKPKAAKPAKETKAQKAKADGKAFLYAAAADVRVEVAAKEGGTAEHAKAVLAMITP